MSDTQNQGFAARHNIDAEQVVLGGIFIDPQGLPEIQLILKKPEMFFRTSHQYIYNAITQLADSAHEIDWVSVVEQIRRDGHLEECGGQDQLREYLSDISHRVPSSYGATAHATIVRDHYVMREVAKAAGDVRAMAMDDTRTPNEVIEEMEQRVFELASQRFHGETQSMQRLIQQVMEQQTRMQEWSRKHDSGALPGLSSGYSDLDQLTTGWKSGELIVIGARPGQGKTSLMLNLVENMSLATFDRRDDGRGGVVVFSLEMTGVELVQRIVCARAGVDLKLAKLGAVNDEMVQKLQEAHAELAHAPVFVDDSFTLNMSEIRSKARRLKETNDIEAIFVDYLQLVKDNDRLDRHLQIGNISRGLKALARELEIPVITAAQLNRGVEQRSSREKRPQLSDLRESGSIEQDADQVLMIHRKEIEEGDEQAMENPPVDLIVAKNRNGPTGDVHMVFKKRFTRFELLDSHRLPSSFAHIPR